MQCRAVKWILQAARGMWSHPTNRIATSSAALRRGRSSLSRVFKNLARRLERESVFGGLASGVLEEGKREGGAFLQRLQLDLEIRTENFAGTTGDDVEKRDM